MPWRGVTVSEQRQRFLRRLQAELLLRHRAGWPLLVVPLHRFAATSSTSLQLANTRP